MPRKKMIIVSSFFPPKKSVATLRITNLSNYFMDKGFDVTGITSISEKFRGVDKYPINPNIEVIEIDPKDGSSRVRNLTAIEESVSPGLGLVSSPSKSGIRTKLKNNKLAQSAYRSYLKFGRFLNLYYPFNIYFAPGGKKYIDGAVKIISEIVEKEGAENVTILTSYSHFTDQYIGYKSKEKFPQIDWITDFRDPMINPRLDTPLTRYQHRINRKINQQANLLTAVSEGLLYKLDTYNDNKLLVRNTFTEDKIQKDDPILETFDIVYTGQLYEERSDPSALMNVLSKLIESGKMDSTKVRLRYAGVSLEQWQTKVSQYRLEAISDVSAAIPLHEVSDWQRRASILLLLSWSDKYDTGVLTGKIYEYIATRNPILALVTGIEDREFEDFFSVLTNSKVVFPDISIEGLEDFVLDHYNYWLETGRSKKLPIENTLIYSRNSAFEGLYEYIAREQS